MAPAAGVPGYIPRRSTLVSCSGSSHARRHGSGRVRANERCPSRLRRASGCLTCTRDRGHPRTRRSNPYGGRRRCCADGRMAALRPGRGAGGISDHVRRQRFVRSLARVRARIAPLRSGLARSDPDMPASTRSRRRTTPYSPGGDHSRRAPPSSAVFTSPIHAATPMLRDDLGHLSSISPPRRQPL